MSAATLLLATASALAPGGVAPALDMPATAPAQTEERTALPSREAIRAAVRDTIAEAPAIPHLHDVDTLRANGYETFARKMDEATTPDCLHSEGLKRQPTFFLSGYLALPFIAVAKLRGVCK